MTRKVLAWLILSTFLLNSCSFLSPKPPPTPTPLPRPTTVGQLIDQYGPPERVSAELMIENGMQVNLFYDGRRIVAALQMGTCCDYVITPDTAISNVLFFTADDYPGCTRPRLRPWQGYTRYHVVLQ